MASFLCPCFGAKTDEDLEHFAAQPLAKALREGWMNKVSDRDRRGASTKVYVRLTADAVAFYDREPRPAELFPAFMGSIPESDVMVPSESGKDMVSFAPKGPVSVNRAPPQRPLEVVLLAQVTSLLGRGKGSECMKIENTRGQWWELRSDNAAEVAEWVEAVSERLKHFREAARRSMAFNSMKFSELETRLSRHRSGCLDRVAQRISGICSPSLNTRDRPFTRRLTENSPRPYRGKRDGHSDLVNGDRLARVTDPDLQEHQGAAWSEQAVRFLKLCDEVPEELTSDFSLTLRQGVPDGLKRLIWPLAAGGALYAAGESEYEVRGRGKAQRRRFKNASAEARSHPNPGAFYDTLTTRAFGSVVPQQFQDPVPTFCQGIKGLHDDAPPLADVVKHITLLTSQGQGALRRLLWCTQLTSHSIDFCPFLPNLFATLLAFFDEAESMMIVHCIIKDFEDDPLAEKGSNPRIVLSRHMINKQAKIFVRDSKKQKNAGEAMAHLEGLGIDLHAMAVELLQDGLAHALPFRALCRVVGSFLREGSEVILRYGIALLKLGTARILQAKTAEDAKQVLDTIAEDIDGSPASADNLMKAAFSIAIKDNGLTRVSSLWGSDYVAPKPDYSRHLFCRPRLFEPRGECPDDLWEAIWSWVPAACRIFDPKLIYVPSMHGTSLRTCLEVCKKHQGSPMIFFVYSKWGDVIGGFSPTVWVRTSGYVQPQTLGRWVEEAFVFRRLARSKSAEASPVSVSSDASGRAPPPGPGALIETFVWTSRNELLLKANETSGLVFGGDGAAIYINKDLNRAETAASESFCSPCLLPAVDHDLGELSPSAGGDAPPSPPKSVDFEIMRFEVFALE